MSQVNNFNKLMILKGFANYYDRKVFYYSEADDYDSAAADSMDLIEDYNFNPNDGIDTKIIIRSSDEMLLSCNYLLVLTNDNNEDIISRWYIMDCVRQSKEIYEVTLRRDVVAEAMKNASSDFYYNAPFYVERGMLDDSSPLVFNDEGLNLNQIKMGEELLQDEYKISWLVGYFDSQTGAKSISLTLPGRGEKSYKTLEQVKTATGIPVATLEALMNGTEIKFATSDLNFKYGFHGRDGNFFKFASITQKLSVDCDEVYNGTWSFEAAWSHIIAESRDTWWPSDLGDYGYDYILDDDLSPVATIKAALTDVLDNQEAGAVYLSEEQLRALIEIVSNYSIYKSGNYYKVDLEVTSVANVPEIVVSKGENTWFDNLVSYSISEYADSHGQIEETNDWEIYVNYKAKTVKANVTQTSVGGNVEVDIPSGRNTLSDNPYDMFAIPIGSLYYVYIDEGDQERISAYRLEQNEALAVGAAIAKELGDSLYDLQILPYAPNIIREQTFFNDQGVIPQVDMTTRGYILNQDYAYIKDSNDVPISCIFFEKKSSVSFAINKNLVSKRQSLKVESQTDFYRICSPNYSGVFEFNLAKNGGVVNQFYVDCTYKPINPFIRVAPDFKVLYGANYKDGRGLICGGDFSLAIIKNNWINYEQYNKNFGAIFARDIQNLEFKQSQERFKEPFAVLSGTAVGAGAGAVAGAKSGAGAYGAIAGAALGAGTGLAGGLIDLSLNEARRAEDKNYARERFNLNLASIKAQPQSLAKNSVLTIINKIWPFIEYYTCTDREVEALEDKIIYDGMTVNAIGKLGNFINPTEDLRKDSSRAFAYFKGELIRAEGIDEDDHFIKTLYNEFAKGVYI